MERTKSLHGAAILIVLLTLIGCRHPMSQQAMTEQRTAFTNATILTSSSAEPLREATVIMEGDVIAWVGPTFEADLDGARSIDVAGAMIIPGLVDAHAHLSGLGQALENVDLVGTTSYEEVIRRLQAMAATLPAGEWVKGRGWDQNDWEEQGFPTREDLDRAIPDHPVAATRIDGHALLANSRALELAGIDDSTSDPEGGSIIRDGDGRATGVFIDNAMDLIGEVIPQGTREDHKRQLERAVQTAAAAGLTGVHDAGVSQETIDILLELAEEGRLPIRVYGMLSDNNALLSSWYERGPLLGAGGDRVTVRSIKLYADGALGSRGAALHEPYSDASDQTGLLVSSPDHIASIARAARQHGFQVGAHAIGDRGSTIVIDAYEQAGAVPDDRFRIEHLQVVRLEDLDRVRAMGVIASMQPTHATSDMPWAEQRLGPERIKGGYAWRSVLDTGIPLAFGSDFPVEEVSPFLGLHAAATRQDLDGHPPGGWTPDEKVSIREAIHGFTEGAAYAAFAEDRRGRIDPGKQADFVVLDRNLLEIEPREIPRTKVIFTVTGGEIVYENPGR